MLEEDSLPAPEGSRSVPPGGAARGPPEAPEGSSNVCIEDLDLRQCMVFHILEKGTIGARQLTPHPDSRNI